MWIKFFSLLKLSLKKKKASFSIGAPTFDYKYELSLEEPATNVIIGIGGDANQHLIPRIHPSSPPPPFQVLHSFHTSLEGTAHFTYKCCTLELDQVLFLLSFFLCSSQAVGLWDLHYHNIEGDCASKMGVARRICKTGQYTTHLPLI